MLILALLFFGLAILVGIYLLTYVLGDKNTPKGVAILHGSLAFVGILLLIIYSFFYAAPIFSLSIFILTLMGGATLFVMDIYGYPLPKILALGHGFLALVGFLLLISFIL